MICINTKKEKDTSIAKFSKEQIVHSNKFINYIDITSAILEDDKQYTLEDVGKIINNFLNKEV